VLKNIIWLPWKYNKNMCFSWIPPLAKKVPDPVVKLWIGFSKSGFLQSFAIMKITTNENDTNDIVQPISITPVIIISALQAERQWSCCRFLLVTQVKSAMKNGKAKGCFGSDVVARSICSHMTQLDTRRWWWRVTSWLRHEALLQVKNA